MAREKNASAGVPSTQFLQESLMFNFKSMMFQHKHLPCPENSEAKSAECWWYLKNKDMGLTDFQYRAKKVHK